MANFRHEHGFIITDKMVEGGPGVGMGGGGGPRFILPLCIHSMALLPRGQKPGELRSMTLSREAQEQQCLCEGRLSSPGTHSS